MKKQIPFFSLNRQWQKNKLKYTTAINEVLESQQFIGGKFVENLEKDLASYLNTNYVKSCNSGTDALWLALKALSLSKNSIVLTSPFSFIASSSEILAHGAHPVFIDIEEKTYNIDPKILKAWLETNASLKNHKAIHKKTGFPVSGILSVNIFGQLANYEEIKKIADEWNLWIIEDACQSIGSNLDGKQAGTFGDIATFSFYPTKNLGAFGDAGCVVTNNEELANKVQMLKNHGRYEKYDYQDYGINSRMDAIQAAVLSVKLKNIDEINNKRRNIAHHYKQNLSQIPFLKLPEQIVGYHSYHQFGIKLDTEKLRDELIKHLSRNGIGSIIFYPKALNQLNFFDTNPLLATDCSIAEKVTKTIMSLPIWPELEEKEINIICDTIKNFSKQMVNSKNVNLNTAI
ncbi:DegT/DnrJ/EryC1/StrS family aminotransferase [Candidatus Babeliales bacterium]|nr:DegT/DnrJ/EryC1/StrS family aminotransferase [Candidatus Babeliales bacterium]